MKTLSLNILDIVQNSIRAKADTILIEINESVLSDTYLISIADNGTGIPKEIFDKVTDPFITTRTKRRMGLGLALLKYHAGLTGGNLKIDTIEEKGTTVTASFSYSHVDRQPLGDIAGVIIMLIAANPEINFSYSHSTDKGTYSFSTLETKAFLGTDFLNERELLNDICSMINENLGQIKISGIITKLNQV